MHLQISKSSNNELPLVKAMKQNKKRAESKNDNQFLLKFKGNSNIASNNGRKNERIVFEIIVDCNQEKFLWNFDIF